MKKYFSTIFGLFLVHVITLSFGLTVASAYSYSGKKWSGTSVNYYINNTFASSFRTAMQAADAAWDNAGSKFRLHYMGTTSRNPNIWAYGSDGHNDIGFFNRGNTGNLIAASIYSASNGTTISESDTTFNTYYDFTTVGANGMYDVQNVMTHEFGHWLRLNDLYDWYSPSWCEIWVWESTMCGNIYTNETTKRSLEGDDKDGIKAIYGT